MKNKFLANLDDFILVSSQEASQMIGGAGTEGIPPFVAPTPSEFTPNIDLSLNGQKKPFPDNSNLPGMPHFDFEKPSQGTFGKPSPTFPDSSTISMPVNGFITPTPSTSFSVSIGTSGATLGVTQGFGNVTVGVSVSAGFDGKISGGNLTIGYKF